MKDSSCLDLSSHAINMVKNSPPLREFLDKEELDSPLPEFNSIHKINNLTPTQICMAVQCFLIRNALICSENNTLYKNDSKYIFGAEEKLIMPPHGLGIIDANEPIILIYFTLFNVCNEIKLIINERGAGALSFKQIIKIFRIFLVNNLQKWNDKFSKTDVFYTFEFNEFKVDSRAILLLTHIDKRFFEHPLIIHSLFTPLGRLRRNDYMYINESIFLLLENINLGFDPYNIIEELWISSENKIDLFFHNTDIEISIASLVDRTMGHNYYKEIFRTLSPQKFMLSMEMKSRYSRLIILLYMNKIKDESLIRNISDLLNDLNDFTKRFIESLFEFSYGLTDEADDYAYHYIVSELAYTVYSYVTHLLDEVLEVYRDNPALPITWNFESVLSNVGNVLCVDLPRIEGNNIIVRDCVGESMERINSGSVWRIEYSE